MRGQITGEGMLSSLAPERLRAVEHLLRGCVPHHTVEVELARKWGLCRRQIRNYIRRVYRDWAADAEQARPHVRAQIQAQFEDLYRLAVAKGELSVALNAADRLAKLNAAYPMEVVAFRGDITMPPSLITDPVRARARLLELRCRQDSDDPASAVEVLAVAVVPGNGTGHRDPGVDGDTT